ncbi:MAG: DUF485 domain-containing protein [Nocardioidaceae bacterium]|nr:DUF485 domain-containing protein [Nocardioidaceae bacterium]NUS51837.1 DUF485 domain-containing protein [Nocardioidaceae bacterium]
MSDTTEPRRTHQRSGHAIYEELHRSPDFQELRRKYRSFAIPWTVAFLAWYLLYVVMCNWATDFMDAKVVGNINVALVFGVLQFLSTFLIAYLYARHANKQLDPLAEKLRRRYDEAVH